MWNAGYAIAVVRHLRQLQARVDEAQEEAAESTAPESKDTKRNEVENSKRKPRNEKLSHIKKELRGVLHRSFRHEDHKEQVKFTMLTRTELLC